MISKGDILVLTGNLQVLACLPKGRWIAATNDKFLVDSTQLLTDENNIFVFNLTDYAEEISIKTYNTDTIQAIYDDAYDNGFTVLLCTWESDTLKEYAMNASEYSQFAYKVVFGWVANGYIAGKVPSLAVNGADASYQGENAVAMHVKLPQDKFAELHVFSPYKPGKGDVFTFDSNGLQFEEVYINGVKRNFKEYLKERNFSRNQMIILAGDYAGMTMNTTIVPERPSDDQRFLYFSCPIYKNIEYRIVELEPAAETPEFGTDIVMSYSCITNFERPELFKYLKNMNGPFVYGEIAYYQMNMATVYLTIDKTV
jgi:hypothetical protein